MIHVYCECGCGLPTPLAKQTRKHLGHVKGLPVRFIQGHSSVLKTGTRYKKDRYAIEDRGFDTPCWVWQLAQVGQGYGCEWDTARRRMVGAHILAYERAYGPVPDGLELDHLCHVRLCVNPDHLEPVTHAENIRRSDYKASNFNAAKKNCPQGHPYAGENLYVEKDGTRRCRECRRQRRLRAKRLRS